MSVVRSFSNPKPGAESARKRQRPGHGFLERGATADEAPLGVEHGGP